MINHIKLSFRAARQYITWGSMRFNSMAHVYRIQSHIGKLVFWVWAIMFIFPIAFIIELFLKHPETENF